VSFGGYSGQAFSPAGDKNRFVLPPSFRKAVKESSGGRILCLDKHDRWNCLVGFGLSRNEELSAQIDREEERALRLGRDFDYGHGEAKMTKRQLYHIAKNAMMLHESLMDGDDLPEWCQSKISQAEQAVDDVAEYLEYKMLNSMMHES